VMQTQDGVRRRTRRGKEAQRQRAIKCAYVREQQAPYSVLSRENAQQIAQKVRRTWRDIAAQRATGAGKERAARDRPPSSSPCHASAHKRGERVTSRRQRSGAMVRRRGE